MEELRISLVQSDIYWEDIQANINHVSRLLKPLKGQTDIVVLPEMFSTGFTMQPENVAETNEGTTLSAIRDLSRELDIAITGSFVASDNGLFFNRGFFITPDGSEYFYDKRHLFSMAGEDRKFSFGDKRLIFNYKGWNICLMICYDLRFPVWSRNINNEYDLLLYVANWPDARKDAWTTLLKARAIENMCHVCGVNRVGIDNKGIKYTGGSYIFSPKGEMVCDAGVNETIATGLISQTKSASLRSKFPVWKDADKFEIVK
jgi:predicted amidohydrolase